eukprot:CAMPEP_0206229178 /NCGR_PEP_ID=MMETSP0047_2-20121206/9557_1 /ASSEMBLY_ACC=CAM_ASM_000192 /TAXON_ID=195065 /ORGANISM="Chroomonas mesostigmatica_cf, Strain CCMP1168" /LENGTH=562 /DNA_ID=CAMNT_0053652457 /DNA_START=123 /DNA_END=1810 /DNA_ORIENTATION=+
MTETVWKYGNVHMTKTSLEQIDTYRIRDMPLHSTPKWRSALEIIVRHEVEAFANDPLFNSLITDKWARFGRRMYLTRSFFPYVAVLILFTVMLNTLCQQKNHDWGAQLDGDNEMAFVSKGFGWRHMWGPGQTAAVIGTSVLRTIMIVAVVPWLILGGWKQRRLGPKDYDPNEDGEMEAAELMLFLYKNLKFILDYCAALTTTLAYIFAYGTEQWSQRLELQLWAVTSVLLWCNFLNVIMPFKFFGILVIIIYKMLIGDFFKFLILYFVLIGGFSQAMFCLFQVADFPLETEQIGLYPGNAFLKLIWVSLGDVEQMRLLDQTSSQSLTTAVYMIWVMLSTVLLVNLLIAMMGQTFDSDMEDTHKTWIFPFSHLVLTYERMLDEPSKLLYRTGSPGQTDGDGDDDSYMRQPYFEIIIEEDRFALEHARSVKAQYKAHRMAMERLKDLSVLMSTCSSTMSDLTEAISTANPGNQGTTASAYNLKYEPLNYNLSMNPSKVGIPADAVAWHPYVAPSPSLSVREPVEAPSSAAPSSHLAGRSEASRRGGAPSAGAQPERLLVAGRRF